LKRLSRLNGVVFGLTIQQARLIQTEAARRRVAGGFRRVEQQHHVPKPNNRLAFSREDRQALPLRNMGLVRWRLERLTKAGFKFPSSTAPRPIPHLKVTDDELLALAQSGLSIPEIAARLGLATQNAHKRIKRLTEQGLMGVLSQELPETKSDSADIH
jgi:MarR family